MYHLPAVHWESLDDDSDEESDFEGQIVDRTYSLRTRINIESFSDEEFFRRFRLSKGTVVRILQRIGCNLQYGSDRSRYISPMNQLLIALRFYASGSFQIVVADFIQCSRSTVCVILPRVSAAIGQMFNQIIRMPTTPEEMREASRAFYKFAKFPNVIGAIDCTHVKIQAPASNRAEVYRNRKGWFSLNVQTIVDANARIINIVARWPGSSHDATIFANSKVHRRFEANEFRPYLLVADGGYRNTDYMLTPYINPQTDAAKMYNISQISTRNVVERSYGIIKRRWPVLTIGMRVKMTTVQMIIVACAILHNIAIDEKELVPPTVDIDGFDELLVDVNVPNDPPLPVTDRGNSRNTVRDRLTQRYFRQLVGVQPIV